MATTLAPRHIGIAASPREMTQAGGLHPIGVFILLAGGSGQSMLFAGLFRSALADVPTHLGGVGSGVLITLQQSGLALGVATLGTLYLAVEPHSIPHAFAGVEYVQIAIIALLAVGVAALPHFNTASADAPIIDA